MARKTHIYRYHKQHGYITEFAGFMMPLWYDGISPEHMAVRESVGLFDITHMGRFLVRGPDAAKFLDRLLTRDVEALRVTQGKYSGMLNEKAGFVDDVTVFRLAEDELLLVGNAANREKDYKWLIAHSEGFDVEVANVSDDMPMFAVQGPKAIAVLNKLTDTDLSAVKRYWCMRTKLAGYNTILSRSGYTGEDGFEIYMLDTPLGESEKALNLWKAILRAGELYGIKPCGLGARDTLRIEAGMCLYEADIDEGTTPLEAKLEFVISKRKADFIGRAALEKQAERGVTRVRVGVKLLERGVPRPGSGLHASREHVGHITSGTFSPLLRCGIAMGYVRPGFAQPGTELVFVIRGRPFAGRVVEMPFYDATKYGWRRAA